MPTSQQPDITKLDTYYKHALDNSGKDQFYRFLYRYVETVVTDDQLFGAAMRFWLESLVSDFQKNKEKLEQFMEKATALTNKPNVFKTSDFFVSMFSLIDKTKIKETKPYYCWYELYNSYYAIRASSINPEHVKKIGSLDFKSKEVKELLGDVQLSDKDINDIKALDFDKFAMALELETQSVVPIKTNLSRDDYLSCLMIFHTDFMDWLVQHPNATTAQGILPKQNKPIQPITNLKLEPKNYDPANGILNIGGQTLHIIKQPNKKGLLHESKEARLMRLLFKNVNTMQDGVPMRKIVSVTPANFTPKHRRKIINYITRINDKISDEIAINDLVIASQLAVMVDSRYL